MSSLNIVDPHLTVPDLLVLENLLEDINTADVASVDSEDSLSDEGYHSVSTGNSPHATKEDLLEPVIGDDLHVADVQQDSHQKGTEPTNGSTRDEVLVRKLHSFNDPAHPDFQPTVFVSWDVQVNKMPPGLYRTVLSTYVRAASAMVRNKTDVVMVTHLLLCFATSLPSAVLLYYHFSYWHAIPHVVMQVWYTGSYTLLRHQHIHMGGVLDKKYAWFDKLFPYITDPLHGHTWNSYYYHHVKHHHVEGNGPDDLSSTIRYQRDSAWHFLQYWGRFFLFIWFDLPRYFLRKNKPKLALQVGVSEFSEYFCIYLLAAYVNFRATMFVFLVPLMITRIGLMIGNWGQHAFVDEVEPDSDYRSSITLIDVASNRYCYNDGYHTSHHLNPRRHWRDHPVSFAQQKHTYASENALVFRNIDYLMITLKLLQKDYHHLAQCLVPIGNQIGMSIDEIAAMLQTKTRAFSEEDIRQKFKKSQ